MDSVVQIQYVSMKNSGWEEIITLRYVRKVLSTLRRCGHVYVSFGEDYSGIKVIEKHTFPKLITYKPQLNWDLFKNFCLNTRQF